MVTELYHNRSATDRAREGDPTVELADDEGVFVAWRTKATHHDGERWIADDGPGERTGPLSRWHHAAKPGGRFGCAARVPADARPEMRPSVELAAICHTCLRILLRPYL